MGKVRETRGWLEEKWNSLNAGRDDAGQDEPDKDTTDIQDIVNIGENIVKRLLDVKVSREAFDSFEMKFKDQMVGEWEEEAHTDLYHGVEIAEYSKFLDKLQKSTGITDKVRQKFETVEFTEKWEGTLKVFTSTNEDKGAATTGKYGMYLAMKRPHEVNP